MGFNSRTYPVGAQILGSGGYDRLLWDRSDDAKGKWKYGFVRAAANLATSAVVNRAGLELQLYPVSFLGFSTGYDWGVRNFTPRFLNCIEFECNGRIDRRYLRGNLFLGHGDFVFAGMFRFEELHSFNSAKPFFDEMTLLTGKADGERVLTWNPAAFYRVNDRWKVGAMSLYSRALDAGRDSHLFGPIVAYAKDSRLNIIGGAGLNRSPVVHSGWCGFAVISYALSPSLSITERQLRSESALTEK